VRPHPGGADRGRRERLLAAGLRRPAALDVLPDGDRSRYGRGRDLRSRRHAERGDHARRFRRWKLVEFPSAAARPARRRAGARRWRLYTAQRTGELGYLDPKTGATAW